MGEPHDYRFGNAELRPQQRLLLVDGRPRPVGARAFDLLVTLIERRDRVVRKNELLDCVWPGMVVEENNLQVHISSLRKLLGPQAIATVPGRGYRFTAALDDTDSQLPRADAVHVADARAKANLPGTAPVLYGRDGELAQLRSVASTHRIVTLVGPGGIGKTVLAQALAHELLAGFPDGVWWCELAPIGEASLVPAAVAGVLREDLHEGGVEELARRLSTRRLLLVIDNCEHLPQAASEVIWALHRFAPGVRVLATSREPLKLAQEHVFRLHGLDVPAKGASAMRTAGALAMLEARVRAADANFELAESDLDEAAEICRHLDGIPLAIEFAAARVPLFGVRGLREQLDERFRVLTRGARLAQPRHQTLHSALEWSFALLSGEQQQVFRRLGVFAGSFGLDSAKRVGGGGTLDGWRVLDHLGDLVDKSLVVAESGDGPRYRLLETTRAFALGKLADAGEVDATRRSHAEAMHALFEAAREDEFALSLQRRMARHARDLDNLRAGLDWAAGPSGDSALLLALTCSSEWVWREAAGRTEGMRRLQLAFGKIDERTPLLDEVRLCIEWNALAMPYLGEVELARAHRAVELSRGSGDERWLALALGTLARTLSHRGDLEASSLAIQEQRSLIRSDWPPFLQARCWLMQGCVSFQQRDYEASLVANQQVMQIARMLQDDLLLVTSRINEEQCASALGRWDECVERGHELVAMVERMGGTFASLEATVAGNLCLAMLGTGDVEGALGQARRACRACEHIGGLACLLESLAPLAFARGFAADAARIMACADAHLAASGADREPVEQAMHDRLRNSLGAVFTAAEVERLTAEGALLSHEAAASLALRDDAPATPPVWPGSSARAEPQGARETHRAHV